LWGRLKARQLLGYKFRRQHGIERYILDFYCPLLRLGIEIDGSVHNDKGQVAYDAKRDSDLNAIGIHILRFSNQMVDCKIDEVLVQVKRFIQKQTPS
jgi:very-short-patch-repair endonuclease